MQKPSAKTPKDRKRAAAAEPPEGQLFVQCEICSKWRLLPDDTQVTRQLENTAIEGPYNIQ